jgi:GxxExxY protein
MITNRKRLKIEMREDGPFQQEGFDLMAAAFDVHNENGGGLAEEVYQESLEIELSLRGIPFTAKQGLAIYYKGRELKRRYVPDLYVCDGMVVELKAVSQLLPEHEAQLFNYMRLTGKCIGYLINFAPLKRAEWRRYVL